MLTWFLLVVAIFALEAAGAAWIVLIDTRKHLKDAYSERDKFRQEVQTLTDALARSNRIPVYRESTKKPLSKSDTWYEGQTTITVVSPKIP